MPEFLPLREEDPARVGPYRLIGRLGAEVYLAEGVEDGPPVVVKLLRPGIDRERFLRLVASIREVSAFCSARVLGSGTADGRPYVVSEYIDGPALAAVTAAGTRLKDAALHRLAVGTATALVAIHQAGAVHGDVRPENMVLGPDGPRPESEPEQQPVRRGPLIAVAAFAAGAMLSGVAVYALAPPRTGAVLAGSASPAVVISSAPPVTPSVTTAPVAGVPPEASDDVELPDIGTTLHEHPQDRVRLTAYLQAKAPFKAFVRDASGRFEEVGQTEEPRVSPDGRWVALNPWVKFQNSEMDHVRVRDLSTGESFTVQTVRKPDTTMVPVWSRDGRRLLLSIKKGDADLFSGFVVVDVAARTAAVVNTQYKDSIAVPFTFTPDGTVTRGYTGEKSQGVETYDLSGKVTGTRHWVGLPRDREWYSPDGRQFFTVCPKTGHVCVWDAATGGRKATVEGLDDDVRLIGWFDDDHLIVEDPGKKDRAQVKVVDFLGRTKRLLADLDQNGSSRQWAAVPR